MSYFQIFIKLIPFLIQLIKSMEIWFSDKAKSGEEKKAAVLESAQAIVGGTIEISTGGQKETWDKLSPLVSRAIDVICAFLFK